MIRIRTLTTALAAIALASVLAACGSSSSGAGSSGSANPGSGSGATASGHSVTIKNFAFSPASLTVKAGTKVTFTNEDGTAHTATASGAKTFDSGSLSKGQSYTYTFTKPGTYHYICTFHNYMKGTIIVQ